MKISKRLFDLFGSSIGLLLLSPLFLGIGILIKLFDGGPVFFRQERVGYKGKIFKIYKFRTMVIDAERMGLSITVEGDTRITRIGCFLRKLKFDEIPQLFNVLLGNMSFVGPRPEVPRYVAMYDEEQRKVLELYPGITDIASIKYRDESNMLAKFLNPDRKYVEAIMSDKIKINLDYARQATIWSDLFVVLQTIGRLFK